MLLYYQVKIAFMARVSAIAIMIPINSLIAKKINEATQNMMKNKDSRGSKSIYYLYSEDLYLLNRPKEEFLGHMTHCGVFYIYRGQCHMLYC